MMLIGFGFFMVFLIGIAIVTLISIHNGIIPRQNRVDRDRISQFPERFFHSSMNRGL